MRKTLLAAGLAASVLAPSAAQAQLTGNMTLITDYRFRGISQTYSKPALQGGIDYAHSSGFYVGNWNSNVSEGAGFPGGNLEMDFYGGWKKTWGDFGLDIGAIYYYYPGTKASATTAFSPANNRTGVIANGKVDNKEIYIGGSWKWLSVKYFHSIDDYFSTPGTKNSHYLDFGATYDLGGGWGINGHLGSLKFKNMNNANYTDWKIGVTKDVSGWVFGASYIDTNAKGSCATGQFYCFSNSSATGTKDAGKGALLFSVTKSF